MPREVPTSPAPSCGRYASGSSSYTVSAERRLEKDSGEHVSKFNEKQEKAVACKGITANYSIACIYCVFIFCFLIYEYVAFGATTS